MWSLWNRIWKGAGHSLDDFAQRLGMSLDDLSKIEVRYREASIPKRSGGRRRILIPDQRLRVLQRRILRRVLARLPCHSAVKGFQQGESIVTHARAHVGQAVLLRLDIEDFFTSISDQRVYDYFRTIGWNRPASKLLTRLCTHEGSLPQGAPTSPRLSNVLNFRLDARLAGLARRFQARYTRYADDLTFSVPAAAGLPAHAQVQDESRDASTLAAHGLLWIAQRIVAEEGYRVHQKRKLHIRRRHERQIVTGLVVNERVGLPRERRRWLRAVEHRLRSGRSASLTHEQLAGWKALQAMIESQRDVQE